MSKRKGRRPSVEGGSRRQTDLWSRLFHSTRAGRLIRRPVVLVSLLTVVVLGLVSGAAGSGSAGADWPQYRSDPAHSGLNAGGSAITTANVGSLTEAWTGATGGSEAEPVVAGGVVYATSGDGKLYAFDAAGASGCSGSPKVCAPLWTTDAFFPTGPVVADGVVYVGSGDGTLYAFDAAGVSGCSGSPKVCQPLWTGRAGPIIASPAVVGGVVYVASFDGSLYAFDAAGVSGCSGSPTVCQPLWTGPTRGSNAHDMRSSPAVVDGVVYVADRDEGDLYAFDAAGVSGCSGSPKVCQPLWTAHTGFVESSPAVAGGVVYVGSFYDGTLYAFDAAGMSGCSGSPTVCQPLWTTNLGFGLSSSPAVAGGIVYDASNSGNIFSAFDAAGVSGCSGSPTVCAPLWTAHIDGGLDYSSPAVASGVVFVGSEGGTLYAFDAAGVLGCSGSPTECAPLWSARTDATRSSPAVAGGFVYVGSSDGTLHAYSLPTPTDSTPPAANPTQLPAVNGSGWNNTDVTVSWNWADESGGSGIDSSRCTTSSLSSGEGDAVTVNASCSDLAGNVGNGSYTVKVDKTAPTLAPTVSPNPVAFNGSAMASPNATDTLSGVASQSCAPVITSVAGVHSVLCTATDNAGNTALASASYTVASPLNAGTTTCTGIYSGGGKDVTVPTGATCILLPGTTVSHDTIVQSGGKLIANGVGFGHDVSLTGAGGSTVCGSSISHDLTAQGSVNGSGTTTICNDDVGHDLNIRNNGGPVLVTGNTVGHDLNVQNNTPGGATVNSNGSGHDATCQGNSPQTGNGNSAVHNNSCPL